MWDGWVSSVKTRKEVKLYVNRYLGLTVHFFFILHGILASTTNLYTTLPTPFATATYQMVIKPRTKTHKLHPGLCKHS